MIRLVLCVGMFAIGYYLGRRSGQQELSQEWTEMETEEQEEA